MPKNIDMHTILRWIYSSMSIKVVVIVHRDRYHLDTEILVFEKCKKIFFKKKGGIKLSKCIMNLLSILGLFIVKILFSTNEHKFR